MAKIETERCPVCNQVGELEVTEAQALMLADGVPAVVALVDRDKLIQDQAEHGIHPACFVGFLNKIEADTSHYDGLGEIPVEQQSLLFRRDGA